MSQRYAPGIRVEIRDAEWRIKRIDHTSDGGELLTCEGLSELVRGREATFLTKIEPHIRIAFVPNKDFVDVGLPRTALTNGISYAVNSAERQEQGIALGWNDIQDLKAGDTVSKTHTDTTQATGPVERTIVYEAPFFKPDREEDYATAWEFFVGEGQ